MSLVSIVIPTWNAEEYLRACLQSVESQTHRDLQVLIVDDESSDASPYIAQQFADKDQRFTHVWQKNRGPGPGGGRNGGLPYAEGDWIFFLDSDDLIPADAIEKLVAVASRTGSDIVTGNVSRFRSGGMSWPTPNHARSHASSVERTHILKRPELAYDSTAWNKLYRTDFWNGGGREFPERKLFEDINPITRAHCESAQTDVIRDQVYLWRVRDDRSSITQQLADARTFADKIEQMTLAHAYLCDHDYLQVREKFEEKALTRDFMQGIDELEIGDDAYGALLSTEGAEFLTRMLSSSIEALPTRDQLKLHLLSEGRIEDLRSVVDGTYEAKGFMVQPSSSTGPRVVSNFATQLVPAVPAHLTGSDEEPALVLSRVFMEWGTKDDLVISATAAIPKLGGPLGRVDDLCLHVRHPSDGFTLPIKPLPVTHGGLHGLVDRLQLDAARRSVRFAPQGRFRVSIPLARLAPHDAMAETEWRFVIGGSAGGCERTTPLPKLPEDRLPSDRTRTVGDMTYEITMADHVALTARRTTGETS